MFDTTQTDRLADDLIVQFDLEMWLGAFEWAGAPLEPAWAKRLALAAEGRDEGAANYADRVHEWGFGHAVQARVRQHRAYVDSLHALCKTWSADAGRLPGQAAADSLAALLEIPHLGIARVSKFICFLNPEHYGIYDSRVSYALKDLSLDGTRRVFPFIGGKQVKHARYVLSDPIVGDARCMAAVYAGFVQLLRRTAEKLNMRGGITGPGVARVCGKQWTPALLEMALFMAGQHREKTPDICRLDTGLWRRHAARRSLPPATGGSGSVPPPDVGPCTDPAGGAN